MTQSLKCQDVPSWLKSLTDHPNTVFYSGCNLDGLSGKVVTAVQEPSYTFPITRAFTIFNGIKLTLDQAVPCQLATANDYYTTCNFKLSDSAAICGYTSPQSSIKLLVLSMKIDGNGTITLKPNRGIVLACDTAEPNPGTITDEWEGAGSIGKCLRWASGSFNPQTKPGTDDLFRSCVRAVRADYCGDGETHTAPGEIISLSTQAPAGGQAMFCPEAAWTRDSALCVWEPRLGLILTRKNRIRDQCLRRIISNTVISNGVDFYCTAASTGGAMLYSTFDAGVSTPCDNLRLAP